MRLLTVAQSAAFLRAVADVDLQVRLVVWRRLQARLLAAWDEGSVLTPARLGSLLSGWVIAADPAGAQLRRKRAEAGGEVSYRRRPDGLGDLFATAVPAPVLQAVLCRIRAASRPYGAADDRPAGERRLDALLNLLLGREHLPPPSEQPFEPFLPEAADPDLRPHAEGHAACGHHGGPGREPGLASGRGPGPDPGPASGPEPGSTSTSGFRSSAMSGSGWSCGCRLDAPVACGAGVIVHVPLGAALGTTDELAELVGHGPLPPDSCTHCCSAPHDCGRCTSTNVGSRSASTNSPTSSPATTPPQCAPPC